MYGVPPSDLDQFAIACCQQQIQAVYGDRSPELERFNQVNLADQGRGCENTVDIMKRI
jgi:hypothetical protein